MWQLSFGKREAYELYNIKKDPYCMENLSGKAEYKTIERCMEQEMFKRLQEQEDPRVFGKGEIFDRYPDTSAAHNFWERTHKGEKVGFGWIKASDFEHDVE